MAIWNTLRTFGIFYVHVVHFSSFSIMDQKNMAILARIACLSYLLNLGKSRIRDFLRFLPIFGEKIGVFLKNQYYDQIFA
jgi:hypothetical protein